MSAALDPRAMHEQLAALLTPIEGREVTVLSVESVAADRSPSELKNIGYGVPLLVVYRAGDEERRVVLRTQSPNWFGHDRRADRADLALLAADTYGDQPRHIQVIDVGALTPDGFRSLRGAGEFYLLTTYAEGSLYANDLRRVEAREACTDLDVARARALALHLAGLHAARPSGRDPRHYHRALRDLVGSGEGIFGITDNYPAPCEITAEHLERLEHLAVAWRWKLRSLAEARITRTHGDFHPYNVLFRDGTDFTLLDASRGGLGDPADDLAAMSVNYLFGGLRHPGAWRAGPGRLWRTFFEAYLRETGDHGLARVFPPFFAWRALVLASPVWYPDVAADVRLALLGVAEHWLRSDAFDPFDVEGAVPMLRAP